MNRVADLLAASDAAPWSTELKRRVQHYGRRYDYGNRTTVSSAPPLPVWAVHLAARLHAGGWMSEPADQVIVNEYLPGQGISAHIDCVPVPPPRRQGGGKKHADDRAVLAAIVYLVQAGCSWPKLPAQFFGVSRSTVHRRFPRVASTSHRTSRSVDRPRRASPW